MHTRTEQMAITILMSDDMANLRARQTTKDNTQTRTHARTHAHTHTRARAKQQQQQQQQNNKTQGGVGVRWRGGSARSRAEIIAL